MSYKVAIQKANSKNDDLLLVASQNSYLIKLSTLFEWAVKNDKMPRNMARGLIIADKTPLGKKRHSFSANQLNIMFSSPLYTGSFDDERGYNRPGTSVTKRSRYWLPLLGLFTGARLNELAQLDVHDIKVDKNIYFIDINDEGEDKSLKTINSKRIVPVHPELIKMGFLTYVESKKINKDKKLCPELENKRTGLYSSIPSKLFAHWLKQIGAKEPKKNYHSFRHTFRGALPGCKPFAPIRRLIK